MGKACELRVTSLVDCVTTLYDAGTVVCLIQVQRSEKDGVMLILTTLCVVALTRPQVALSKV